MHDILLGIGVAAFVVYAIFNIAYIMSMKRMTERLETFLHDTQGNLSATLEELKGTLENTRKVTGDVKAVTADVREIADTVVLLERGVRNAYRQAQDTVLGSAEANVAGLKAGIKTGVATLVKNLQQGRGDDDEGGTEH
ncbi:MAG: DUF948 domain-containing protein [Nitrospiraceae bacterium]|nr:DUF948 domain-containing protein [Nitrospiraceae bacterium]